jgi:O-6-methylguanine DNA methyltransferase
MTKGDHIPSIGCYLIVDQSGKKVKRVYFSRELPEEHSILAQEIAAFLEGRAPCPKPELDLSDCTKFQKKVYTVVKTIPRGETMTYGEVAILMGCPGAARAVGQALSVNPIAVLIPCHRVVAKQDLGGFAWGLEVKEKLQSLERSPHKE